MRARATATEDARLIGMKRIDMALPRSRVERPVRLITDRTNQMCSKGKGAAKELRLRPLTLVSVTLLRPSTRTHLPTPGPNLKVVSGPTPKICLCHCRNSRKVPCTDGSIEVLMAPLTLRDLSSGESPRRAQWLLSHPSMNSRPRSSSAIQASLGT